MTTNRIWHTATSLVNGNVLLAGGLSQAIASAELYNPGVGAVPGPVTIANAHILANGSFQLSFTSTPSANFSLLASPFPTLPSSQWMVLGLASEISLGHFLSTDTQITNFPQRFYSVRSP
jgi:hypothetical protein